MEEVIINTSYNHMVNCRNEKNNTYENLFFILYEYIYVLY